MKAAAPNVDHARKRGVVIAVFLAIPLACILCLGVRSVQQKAAQKAQSELRLNVQQQQQQAAQLADQERQRQYYGNQLTQNLEERRRFEQQYAAPSSNGYMAGQDQAANPADDRLAALDYRYQNYISEIDLAYKTSSGIGVSAYVLPLQGISDEMRQIAPQTSNPRRAQEMARAVFDRFMAETARMSGMGGR